MALNCLHTIDNRQMVNPPHKNKMKKRIKDDKACSPHCSPLFSFASLFINASEQRFFSSLLLNFLCLKRAQVKSDDSHDETSSEGENESDSNSAAALLQSNVYPIEQSYPCHLQIKTNSPGTSAPLEAIFAFLTVATDGRITRANACEKDGKTIRKPFVRDIILLLGTLRARPHDSETRRDNLRQLSKNLEKCVNDMSCLFHITECQKADHRECRITLQPDAFLDNGATLDLMTRRCIVMVATLQRKALQIAIRRKRIKNEIEKRLAQPQQNVMAMENLPHDQNENTATDNTHGIFEARDVANALKEAYQREEELSEQLSRTQAQLEHISDIIDSTRQAVIKLSTFLLELYRATFLRTQKTQQMLRRMPGIPNVLNDTFMIETVCTDLLQTIEIMRQFSINAEKLIENNYQDSVNKAIWPTRQTTSAHPNSAYAGNQFSQKYHAIHRLQEDTFTATSPGIAADMKNNQSPESTSSKTTLDDPQNANEDKRECYIKRLSETYKAFLQITEQTRRNVNQHTYQHALHDIRAMAFSFFTILEKRLSARSNSHPTPLTVKTDTMTHQVTTTTDLDDIVVDEINIYENEHLMQTKLSESTAAIPYLAKRHLAPRAIGEMTIHLRNEQNVFQLDYLINAISRQMENLYSQKNTERSSNAATGNDKTNEVAPAIDACIVSNLQRINNANFDLNVRTWKNVEKWPYTDIDHFRFTHLAANLSNLQSQAELKGITELIALYAYLLSYKLEQILFVPRAEQDNIDTAVNSTLPDERRLNSPADSVSSHASEQNSKMAGQETMDNNACRRALKRRHNAASDNDRKEEGPPWYKRKRTDDNRDNIDSDEEMPMIIRTASHDDEAMPSIISTTTRPTGIAMEAKRSQPITNDSHLHKPKAQAMKRKSYSKIYRSRQKDALRMFYKNEAITNLGDILQGVRFEIRQKTNNVASYEKTLRRLQDHLNKLKSKKKSN